METLSRRTFLAGTSGTALALAGGVRPSFAQAVDMAAAKKEGKVVWYCSVPVATAQKIANQFQQQTGIKATYAEDIDDNDSYYGKVQGQLKNGDDIGKDVIVLTDWMATRMIRQGYVQKLDKANIPNASNLVPSYQNVDWDPGRKYTLTWQGGYAGIGYRKDKVGRELHSLDDLWSPDLKGKVVVLDELRDTVGVIMLSQGVDISSDFSEDQFMTALDELQKQVDSGQIRKVTGNSYLEDLRSGNAIAAIAWSGDMTTLAFEEDDPNYSFSLPDTGGTLWSDNLMVPIASPHKTNAEKLFNYYYEPEVAAEVAAYVNYICPVEGAQAEMEKIDPSQVDNPLIFPTPEYLQNVKAFRSLSPEEETTFNEAFQKVIGN
jgi:spermidine/putrescine transport system substrate-binding protein